MIFKKTQGGQRKRAIHKNKKIPSQVLTNRKKCAVMIEEVGNLMGPTRNYEREKFIESVKLRKTTRCTTISLNVQLWLYFFWLSKYNQKYNLWCIDTFLNFIYTYSGALLKAESQRKSDICQAKPGQRIRLGRICKEIEFLKIDKKTGGISNEKDISDISHFNFLIHFFVPLSK
jgi:hypothetical protein